MRIEQGIALDFCDVLLKPKRSTIESRKDVDLFREFKFLHSTFKWAGVPIISANMSSVTTQAVAEAMSKRYMIACLPKGMTYLASPNYMHSFGLKDKVDGWPILCLDVPNGYLEVVVDRVKEIRERYPNSILAAGNVVTAEQTEALLLAGADIVKVGIGGGSACSTRIKTGVGLPQLSSVIECADAAHGLGGHIISDGGCSVPGDVCKAFAAGADFVMLGGMLAGHDENGTDFYGMSSTRANNEFAGGLRDYRAAEGWELKLPGRGPIDGTLSDIEGGIRSACSYVGARTIKDLPKCATFVRVGRQVNTSLLDYRV